MVITGWEEGKAQAALLIYMASRGGGVDVNHPGHREDPAEDVSLNLNTVVYQTPLLLPQVSAAQCSSMSI